jgi:Fur family ferric uptake transcriptional regulator
MKKQSSYLKEKEKLAGYLEDNDLRITKGREEVLKEVFRYHGHFTAEELLKACRHNNRGVSRATVYRSLREFFEANIVRKTALGDKHDHYEHVYDEKVHHHAKCVRCGEYLEIPDMNEDSIYKPILEKLNFKVISHEMHFYGICRNCQG